MTVRRVISQVAQQRRFAYARLPVKFHRRLLRQRLQRRLGFGGAVQQPAKRPHARPHGSRARARLCRNAVVNQAAFRRADLQPHGAIIVARRDDVAGGDARQLIRAPPIEPAIEVVPETDGQLSGRGERRGDDVIFAQLSLEGVEQLRLLGLLVTPFSRYDPVIFEVDEAGQVALARAAILFLGDPGAVAAADDSDVDLGAVYLIERCALSGLRAAAEIFHAYELARVHAVDSVLHGMALGLQIEPRRTDENACDGWEHLTPPCLARSA